MANIVNTLPRIKGMEKVEDFLATPHHARKFNFDQTKVDTFAPVSTELRSNFAKISIYDSAVSLK